MYFNPLNVAKIITKKLERKYSKLPEEAGYKDENFSKLLIYLIEKSLKDNMELTILLYCFKRKKKSQMKLKKISPAVTMKICAAV